MAGQGARELTTDWRRVGALFDEALELDAAGRERLLARAAETEPAIANEVRSLLRAHDTSGAFLDRPAWAVAPELLDESADAPLVGTHVGAYDIQEEVGRGGMGVVYAARDERLGRIVALKILPRAYSRDARARERLAREARAAAALSHPSIATVYALEEIDGELYLASELVRGVTLRSTIASGRLSATRALEILLQLAEALDAAHRAGIVHRDLKPENVLLNADGRVKVVDFGIARSLAPPPAGRPLTVAGTAIGTPGYMAPEQLRGDTVDARADVFAFGVIAYELATGEHPFGGNDPASLVERLVAERPPLSQTLQPPALDAIVRHRLRGDAKALRVRRRALRRCAASRTAPPVPPRACSSCAPRGGGSSIRSPSRRSRSSTRSRSVSANRTWARPAPGSSSSCSSSRRSRRRCACTCGSCRRSTLRRRSRSAPAPSSGSCCANRP